MRTPSLSIIGLIVLGGVSIPGAYALGQQYRTSTQDGVYTAAQADQGRALYEGACASCHGSALEGAFDMPPLTGRMVRNWSGRPVEALFAYVSDAMPQMMPGSLPPEDNAAIIAYILQQNGMPAGKAELPSDREALQKIAFRPVSAAASPR